MSGEHGTARATAAPTTASPQQGRPPARVVPLSDDPQRGADLRALVDEYAAARADDFAPEMTVEELAAKVLDQAQYMHVALGYRGERPVGFAMMEGRRAKSGRNVWVLADLYAPGDLGVSRLLCRAAECAARRFGYDLLVAQSRSEVVGQVAKWAGFAPRLTIYAKEL